MKIVKVSDVVNTREINQDDLKFHIKDDHHALAVLCDGMGGHLAGEVASKETTQLIINKYKELDLPDDMLEAWIKKIILDADAKVILDAKLNPEYEGMGTTVVMALIQDDILHLSNVGDSRAYFFKNNELTQLTVDHTLVQALVQNGTITQLEAVTHPQRNILLQAVGGGNDLEIPYGKYDLKGELILLCSDGLYNSLTDDQIIKVLNKDISLEDKGQELVDKANVYGGLDNVSVILIQTGDQDDK